MELFLHLTDSSGVRTLLLGEGEGWVCMCASLLHRGLSCIEGSCCEQVVVHDFGENESLCFFKETKYLHIDNFQLQFYQFYDNIYAICFTGR